MDIKLNKTLNFLYELLLENGKPMHRDEIFKAMLDSGEVLFSGETPKQTITKTMNGNSIETEGNERSYKNNKFLFTRVDKQTWAILDPEIRESVETLINLIPEEEKEEAVETVLRRMRTDPKKRS